MTEKRIDFLRRIKKMRPDLLTYAESMELFNLERENYGLPYIPDLRVTVLQSTNDCTSAEYRNNCLCKNLETDKAYGINCPCRNCTPQC